MPLIEQIVLTGPPWFIPKAWLVLMFVHWVTDYGLQTRWIAENKHRDPRAMMAHCGINGAGVMLITLSVELGLAEMMVHLFIDKAKRHGVRDQTLHALSKGLWALAWWHFFPKG